MKRATIPVTVNMTNPVIMWDRNQHRSLWTQQRRREIPVTEAQKTVRLLTHQKKTTATQMNLTIIMIPVMTAVTIITMSTEITSEMAVMKDIDREY